MGNFIEHKGNNDGYNQVQDNLPYGNDQGVADDVCRIGHGKDVGEVIQANPLLRAEHALGRHEALESDDCRRPIEFTLYTGLRISEVLGLTWSDVDLAAGVITVRNQLLVYQYYLV